MNKKIMVASIVAVSGIAGLNAVSGVSAQSMQDAVKERAGQYSAQREEARTERQAEHQASRELRVAELPSRLDEAVANGVLTEAQKDAVINKHEDMQRTRQQWYEDKSTMSPEERRESAAAHRAEMQAWAEKNGIPEEFMGRSQKSPAQHSFGGGNGMRWNQNQ